MRDQGLLKELAEFLASQVKENNFLQDNANIAGVFNETM